jgi:hypothetical protein
MLEQRCRTDGSIIWLFNPFKAELNPICHLLALLGAHHIFHVSRIRVNEEIFNFGTYVMTKIQDYGE